MARISLHQRILLGQHVRPLFQLRNGSALSRLLQPRHPSQFLMVPDFQRVHRRNRTHQRRAKAKGLNL